MKLSSSIIKQLIKEELSKLLLQEVQPGREFEVPVERSAPVRREPTAAENQRDVDRKRKEAQACRDNGGEWHAVRGESNCDYSKKKQSEKGFAGKPPEKKAKWTSKCGKYNYSAKCPNSNEALKNFKKLEASPNFKKNKAAYFKCTKKAAKSGLKSGELIAKYKMCKGEHEGMDNPARDKYLGTTTGTAGGQTCEERYGAKARKSWQQYLAPCQRHVKKGGTLSSFRDRFKKKKSKTTKRGEEGTPAAAARAEGPSPQDKASAAKLVNALKTLAGKDYKWGPQALQEQKKHPAFDRILKAVYSAAQKGHVAAKLALQKLGVIKGEAQAQIGADGQKKTVPKAPSDTAENYKKCTINCEKKYPGTKNLKKQSKCIMGCRKALKKAVQTTRATQTPRMNPAA